jgi:hypothetical protein
MFGAGTPMQCLSGGTESRCIPHAGGTHDLFT